MLVAAGASRGQVIVQLRYVQRHGAGTALPGAEDGDGAGGGGIGIHFQFPIILISKADKLHKRTNRRAVRGADSCFKDQTPCAGILNEVLRIGG